MKVFSSNNLDILFDKFSEDFLSVKNEPFYREKILIQTEGIEKWLTIKIASRKEIGIMANIDFLYPKNFITSVLKEAGLYLYNENYKIINTFFISDFLKNSEAYKNTSYFELYNLSSYLSDLLDQYAVYRPELLAKWKKGQTFSGSGTENMQKEIYNHILSRGDIKELDAMIVDFLTRIDFYSRMIQEKFKRIFVFGVSALPPLFLRFIMQLNNETEIFFYIKTPSALGMDAPYRWIDSDIASEKKVVKSKIIKKVDPQKGHFTIGNPLLLNNSQTARDFFQLIFEYIDDIQEEIYFPDENTILNRVKKDILSNKLPTPRRENPDNSIEVHTAHTPLREVEILYNNILKFFEEDDSLKSNEIIVMTPDIDKYAHYIRTVFTSSRNRIQFSIADETDNNSASTERIILKIINIKKSRFTFSWIMDLIDEKPIRQKFDISEQDTRIIKKLFKNFKTAWGIDESHKTIFEIPENQWENTWKSSIENILTGYCNDSVNVEGITKDLFNISYTATLGKFLNFFDTLVSFQKAAQQKRKIAEWGKILDTYIFRLLDIEHKKFESKLKRFIQIFSENSELEVDFDYISASLTDFISQMKNSHLFLNGGITFCQMLPMRSIPHKIICLIGMDESSYPRNSFDKCLNLMAEYPRKGDRDIRQYDRYLFLESVLSAEKKFYLSYVGQDIKTNDKIPSSILVTELLNYIKDFYLISEEDIVIHHPLHSFNKKYFMNDRLKNYDEENFKLSRTESSKVNPNKISPVEVKQEDSAGIESIIEFYSNPIKYYYKNLTGIQLEYILQDDSDKEELEPEVGYYKQQPLFDFIFKNSDNKDYGKLKNTGVLPLKKAGELLLEKYLSEADEIIQQLSKNIPDFDKNKMTKFELKNNPEIHGCFEHIYHDNNKLYYIPILRKTELSDNKKINFIIKASILSVALNLDVIIIYFKKNRTNILITNNLSKEVAVRLYGNFIKCYNNFKNNLIVVDPDMGFDNNFSCSTESVISHIQKKLDNIYATSDIYKDFFIRHGQMNFVDMDKNQNFYESIYTKELKDLL